MIYNGILFGVIQSVCNYENYAIFQLGGRADNLFQANLNSNTKHREAVRL